MSFSSSEPTATLGPSMLTATFAPGPPGGRPPGRLVGGQMGTQIGPVGPGGTAPASPGSLINAQQVKQGALALLATGLAVGVGVFLYKDHTKVTMARNGETIEEAPPARKRGRGKKKTRREEEDDEDDDG